MSLIKLKSGTDIRGTALGEAAQLNDGAVKKIICAFVKYLSEKTGTEPEKMSVCLGHDSRLSAKRICTAVCESLSACGVRVLFCSLSSTPAMFMATVKTGCTASIMVTASHHPYDKNGLKFFTEKGGFAAEEIEEILIRAEETEEIYAQAKYEELDFMSEYAEGLCDMIRKELCAKNYDYPLKGLHIIADASNGAGGFFERDVLRKLGADTSGSLFLEPDGHFPNHIPNPEDESAMSFICKAVKDSRADLGIIFDTDVDRAACVDSSGREINRNTLIALASAIALENNPAGTVVTDSVTSDGLKAFINNTLGGVHYRYKRGYKNVIDKAVELNSLGINCPLAIETSGHAAFRENYFLDDGAYLMTKIIILLARLKQEGRELSSLFIGLLPALEEKEKRYIIGRENFSEYGKSVIKEFKEYCERFPFISPADDNREGWRVSFDADHGDGWLLLRMSVHDPVLPLNMESRKKGGVKQMEDFFDDFINGFDALTLKK